MIKVLFLCVAFLYLNANVGDNTQSYRAKWKQLVNNIFQEKAKNNKLVSYVANAKVFSQIIAKDAVLMAYNIKKPFYYKDMLSKAKAFENILRLIRYGHPKLNIKPNNNKEINYDLIELEDAWKNFYKAVKTLYNKQTGKINKVSLKFIIENNEKILRLSHKLLQTIQSQNTLTVYTDDIKVFTLQFANRERMLSQKILKDKLILFSNYRKDKYRVKLRGSYILFDNALKGFIYGDKKRGIVAITNKKILKELKKLEKIWNKIKDIYKKPASKKQVLYLISLDNRIYNITNKIYKMVEKETELY